ncbi:MAG: outer membrane lipoprotein-sorting protein [Desulfomonile tiedjei]|nr:outer membrane lipoprotein-sorting protein [Desulfomonile tiedjei]
MNCRTLLSLGKGISIGWAKHCALACLCSGLVLSIVLGAPPQACAMTAQEILEQVAKQNFQESFRASLSVKTSKGKKTVAEHTLWLMARTEKDKTEFFVDFEAPPESKGLRFLFLLRPEKTPQSFMYLPATGKTVPLAVDDPSVDLGGTGLSVEDIQGFMPKGGETATLVKEEKVEGRDCYMLRVELPDGKGQRDLWVGKNGFVVVKSQYVDAKGQVKRTFRVVEFFRTEKGTEFPREEDITVPDKDLRIRVRQENAVFGIELPDEIMNPEKFGTYRWRD